MMNSNERIASAEAKAYFGKGLPDNMPPADDDEWNALTENEKEQVLYAYARATVAGWADGDPTTGGSFNNNNLAAATGTADVQALVNDARNKALGNLATSLETKYDYGGQSIATQEDAQLALDAINNAIVEKDKIRAHLGATQNRLENTVTNLTIQSENLQNAESRIRDVDVATEMTNFVRNQVLTQSAVAMLSQANSMPQMAMQLIG